MREHLELVGIRGTIFIPQIPFSWELTNKFLALSDNLIPSVNTTSSPIFTEGQTMNPTVISPGEWSLSSPDGNLKVIFNGQKTDVLRRASCNYSIVAIDEFGKLCRSIFDIISESSGSKCTRLAIAPTFEYMGSRDSIVTFADDCFRRNRFKDAKLDNCDFSQVFRVPENISEMIVTLNYLSKFYSINKIVSRDGINQLAEAFMIDFDINSIVNPEIVFNRDAICEFFTKSADYCEDFLSFYFNE